MRLHFCGTRGSTPAPGPEHVRYGGHTSCVAIARDTGQPTLLLDAGTGLRRFATLLDGRPFRGTILLTQLHWDHTQGLPFFSSGDRPDAKVTLFMPAQGDPEKLLERMISPPFFPIAPRELRGEWRFQELEPGEHTIEGFSVLALDIPHKGGRTFGYRISDGVSTVAYIPDHSPIVNGRGADGLGAYHDAALALADGVDLLIHDGQHTADEFERLSFLGHATVEYAVGLARKAGAKKVLLFHHDPARTDDDLDAIVARQTEEGISVEAAVEGSAIALNERST